MRNCNTQCSILVIVRCGTSLENRSLLILQIPSHHPQFPVTSSQFSILPVPLPAMKALVLDAPEHLRIGDWPAPECGPRDVLIRPIAAGICAGDMQHYAGRNPYTKYPLVCGHEICGTVTEVGAEVRPIQARRSRRYRAGGRLRPLLPVPARQAKLLYELLSHRAASAGWIRRPVSRAGAECSSLCPSGLIR